jgi:hypothetical protein
MLRRLLQWLDRRIDKAVTRVRTLHGVRVVVLNRRPDIEEEVLFARVDAALGLIARVDARRFRRLSRDLVELHVRRGFTRGAFYPATRTCVLDNTFVANAQFTVNDVAACIVHEAMHARVAAMGVRVEGRDRAREERICRKAELAFAARTPDGAPSVVERAGAVLVASDEDAAPVIDYDEVRRRVAAADLAAAPLPGWYKRWLARRHGLTLPG